MIYFEHGDNLLMQRIKINTALHHETFVLPTNYENTLLALKEIEIFTFPHVMFHHKFDLMYRSNRSFNFPPTPGHLTFLKIIVQIPPYLGQNAVQMPHTRVHSGDQMPPPRGHFTGT